MSSKNDLASVTQSQVSEPTKTSAILNETVLNTKNYIYNASNIQVNEPMLDMDWQTVPPIKLSTSDKRKRATRNAVIAKRSRHNSLELSELENRYLLLSDYSGDEELDADNTSILKQREKKTTNEPKPPPIFIPGVKNINTMLKSLNTLTKSELKYKCTRDNEVKLFPASSDAYREIVSTLRLKNMNFHTYQLKQQREFKIVIKGLHHTTDIDDIKHDLQKKGHKVRNIINARNKFSRLPMPMFFVGLEPQTNNKDVYNISSINNAIITIEPPHKNTILSNATGASNMATQENTATKIINV